MNKPVDTTSLLMATACPHDCPSTCALEVEVVSDSDGRVKMGRVRGSKDNTYTDGVICAKVARYAERVNHPDRLLKPLQRTGAKGSGDWRDIGWDDALDLVAEQFIRAEQKLGAETVWPYFYAGTMGLVQRDSIQRLRHAKGYSQQFDTICVNPAWSGFSIGTGRLMGPDPREMAVSDCVVIWGTNAVATQVNVMTHAVRARKTRGAKIVAIDIYENATMKQADLALLLRPGTDGALACAVMHCLFRDGTADREYMAKYADCPEELEAHLKTRTPEWASSITGLPVEQIEEFAALLGKTPRSFLRLGYGFTRSRNGTTAMHAASSVATVLGAWQHEGGGAFHSNSSIFEIDGSLIKGENFADPNVRALDQSQIGPVLTGDAEALRGGPPVTAMLIQNTNPMNVAPEQDLVREGFARDDLFVAVHEQFLTDTAAVADVVLPATMFVEHDDIYRGGGHQHILLGPKILEGPELCRTNFFVIEELAKRLGVADHEGFGCDERGMIDDMLKRSNRGSWDEIKRDRWIDCQPDFATSHYVDGFAHADGKFHFKADWNAVPWGRPPESVGVLGPVSDAPMLPDHWAVTEEVTEEYPLRLATSPARSFLNSTFAETASSRKKEGHPTVLVHPDDAASLGVADGDAVRLESARGTCQLHAEIFEGVRQGVLVSEGIYPNSAHVDGKGLNSLTGADPVAPHGGAAFHDNRVRMVRL